MVRKSVVNSPETEEDLSHWNLTEASVI
jgi:hypothetical protein